MSLILAAINKSDLNKIWNKSDYRLIGVKAPEGPWEHTRVDSNLWNYAVVCESI